jgi:predicted small lipoprotein YifL
MLRVFQILVSLPLRRVALAGGVVALLAACGQKGPLFLPTGEAAAGRATLTETLARPIVPASPASAPSTTGTATPIPIQ